MTKSDNLEDAFLSLYLANGSTATSNILTSNSLAAAGSGVGSTNLYLQLHTNGIPETASNLNAITSEVGYSGYSNLCCPITRDTNNWDRLSAGLWANGNTANFTFPPVGDAGSPVVTHWSLTDTNGNIGYSGPLSSSDPQPFTAEDGFATNAVCAVAHGFASNDSIILIALPNVTFPSGVSSNTLVYASLSNSSGDGALTDTADYFRVKLTTAGVIVDIGSGAGLVAAMNEQTLAQNNTPRFVTNALRITED